MRIFLYLIFFLFLNQIAYSKIVKSTAEYKHLGDEISQKEACTRAEKKAKENAIKNALGLKVSLEETQKCKEVDGVNDCEYNQVYVLSLNGEIIESIILKKKEGVRENDGEKIYFCKIEIEANVEAAFKEDSNFQFGARLNSNTFKNGDNLEINIISGQEMYLNIFQFFPYEKINKVVKLFPNEKEKINKIKNNKFILPTPGLKYVVEFPVDEKNKKSIDEHLIFIATKDQVKWLNKYFSLEDFNKRLIEIGNKNVVKKEQKTYTIIK
jgi:hypothetical protein